MNSTGEPGGESTRQTAPQRGTRPLDWSGVLAEQGYVIGVDLSGGGERAVLADLSGSVVARDAFLRPDNGHQQPEEVVERVRGQISGLLAGNDIKAREVLRLGIGFGGPVDAARGSVRLSHDNRGWEGFPLAAEFEKAFDVPTLLDNDARLAALGEVWFGAGQADPGSHLVYVHWSRGVGGGLVVGGKLVRGESTIAGEIGHITVRTGDDALPCRCGGKGHLEAYVRAPALEERARTLLRGLEDVRDAVSIAFLFEEAERDPRLEALAAEVVEMMALTIGNLITAFNPGRVVIGGQVAREAARCIPQIADAARAYAMPLSAHGVEVVPASLGEDSGVMGAVALGLDSLR